MNSALKNQTQINSTNNDLARTPRKFHRYGWTISRKAKRFQPSRKADWNSFAFGIRKSRRDFKRHESESIGTVSTMEKLEAILAKQMPDAETRRRADFIVDTSQRPRPDPCASACDPCRHRYNAEAALIHSPWIANLVKQT